MPKIHGAAAASLQQIQRFHALRKRGLTVAKAAEAVNMSRGWGYRQSRIARADNERALAEMPPDPKSYSELDGGVKDTLRDFGLFSEVFLCRRPTPWRIDAAKRTVEMLLDKTKDDYVVVNLPPGAGKTSLFTHDLAAWLICGGGTEDPAVGRALRIMLGHRSKNKSAEYVLRLRRFLTLRGPFYDEKQKREADLSPGRCLRPLPTPGDAR
jgi:hypothetical protein